MTDLCLLLPVPGRRPHLLLREYRPFHYIPLHNGFHSPVEYPWLLLLQLLRHHNRACICLQELILGYRFLPTPWGYISFTSAIRGSHGWDGAVRAYAVCSLYLAPGVPIARDYLVELIRQLQDPFLLVSEFNTRHPS